MDPLISVLNAQAAKNVGATKNVPFNPVAQNGESRSAFDKTLTEKLVNRIEEQFSLTGGTTQMKALPAGEIKLEPHAKEFKEVGNGVTDQFTSMFKKMNRDVLSLDTTMEWLTTPGTKFSVRDLFRIQTGLTETTLHVELGTKIVDVVTRDIQTLQNVGV